MDLDVKLRNNYYVIIFKENKMKKNNVLLGLVMCGVSIAYYMTVSKLSEKAAMYPKFIAMVLFLLSFVFTIKTIFIDKNEEDSSAMFEGFLPKQFAFVLAMAFVYVFLIKILGYFFSTALFLLVTLGGLRAKRVAIILTSIGVCAFIFVVFKVLLNVPLPKGFIF
jgi:hypothetical protein